MVSVTLSNAEPELPYPCANFVVKHRWQRPLQQSAAGRTTKILFLMETGAEKI